MTMEPSGALSVDALIASTYSDSRPDPYNPSQEISATIKSLWDLPGAACIARFWLAAEDPPEWEPSFANKLEDYLYEECESEEEAAQRLEELRAGAPLTEAEKSHYEESYWNWDAIVSSPVYYLHRLTENRGDDMQSRSVYFLTEHVEMGQYGDQQDEAGPFRSLDEVVEGLTNNNSSSLTAAYGGAFDFDSGWDADVTRELKERLAGLGR